MVALMDILETLVKCLVSAFLSMLLDKLLYNFIAKYSLY